eukprot:jgi/Mesen1/5464/ME000273S04695
MATAIARLPLHLIAASSPGCTYKPSIDDVSNQGRICSLSPGSAPHSSRQRGLHTRFLKRPAQGPIPHNRLNQSCLARLQPCMSSFDGGFSQNRWIGRKGHLMASYSRLAAIPPTQRDTELLLAQSCASEETKEISSAEQIASVFSLLTRTLHMAALIILATTTIQILLPGQAYALGSHSIGKSSLGQSIATWLRSSGCPDEAIIFLMAMLPVIELRGSVPVGYWMGLEPVRLSALAILGNMVPVPFILLFLGPISNSLMARSQTAEKAFNYLFEHTRKKAGPIEEFRWLGLMLFVAVPLPGTGAWSGAIAAYILGLPFWDAFWANFFGVVVAGLIMNMLCMLGLKYAVVAGVVLFLVSTFVWSFLRWARTRMDGPTT